MNDPNLWKNIKGISTEEMWTEKDEQSSHLGSGLPSV